MVTDCGFDCPVQGVKLTKMSAGTFKQARAVNHTLLAFALLITLNSNVSLTSNVAAGNAQATAPLKGQANKRTPSPSNWIEDKVSVQAGAPYISSSGNLVLPFTVTNKSGADIALLFSEDHTFSSNPQEPIRLYLKLKDSQSYKQVMPKDHFIYLDPHLLPMDLPLLFNILVAVSPDDRPSRFSLEDSAEQVRNVTKKTLGNVDHIAIFLPDRHLKIVFPIRK